MADALDLKSSEVYPSYRFEPGFRHHPFLVVTIQYRGVEQLVARRAHNPEVAGSTPVPATKRKSLKTLRFQGFFFFSQNSNPTLKTHCGVPENCVFGDIKPHFDPYGVSKVDQFVDHFSVEGV